MNKDAIFQTVEKSRLSHEVARQLMQAIQEGRFVAGEALPPERELAAQFDVSRPILREALSILQIQGFVTVRHGRGTFVKDPNTDIFNIPLTTWLKENRALIENFYEARLAIEPVCAARAAELATPDDVAALKEILGREQQLVADENIPTMISVDIDFHAAIAQLSGNEFLIKMLNSLITPETDIRKIVLRLPSHLSTTHSDHEKVLEAIKKHDPKLAKKAMTEALSKPLKVVQEYLNNEEK